MSSDEAFGTDSSGAAYCEPRQCSALRKNGFVMLHKQPCKIVQMSTSKTGKHGSAKVHLVGIDIFTGKKHEEISPSTANMQVPHVEKEVYTVVNLDNGYLTLMDENGVSKVNVPLPVSKDMDGKVEEKWNALKDGEQLIVTVISAMGKEAVIAVRVAKPAR